MELEGNSLGEKIIANHNEVVAQKQEEQREAERQERARLEEEHQRALEREPLDLIIKLLESQTDTIHAFPTVDAQQGHAREAKNGTVMFNLRPDSQGRILQLGIGGRFTHDLSSTRRVELSVHVYDPVHGVSSEYYLTSAFPNDAGRDQGEYFRAYLSDNDHPGQVDSHVPKQDARAFIVDAIYEAAEVAGIPTLPQVLPVDEIPA